MADYFSGVAQSGAQMFNSAIDSMDAKNKLEEQKRQFDIQNEYRNRALASRQSGLGSGNDPVSKGARSFTAITEALNAHSDQQIALGGELSKLQKDMSVRGYGTDEDNMSMQRVQARMANNDYAFKMMTSSLGGGKFEYEMADVDGSKTKAVFNSAADLEAYKALFRPTQDQGTPEAKNESVLRNIFGGKKSAPKADPEMSTPMSVEPVPVVRSQVQDSTSLDEAAADKRMAEYGMSSDESPKNPAATGGGGGRRGYTQEDAKAAERKSSAIRMAALEKDLQKLSAQKVGKSGKPNSVAMRNIAIEIEKEKRKQEAK